MVPEIEFTRFQWIPKEPILLHTLLRLLTNLLPIMNENDLRKALISEFWNGSDAEFVRLYGGDMDKTLIYKWRNHKIRHSKKCVAAVKCFVEGRSNPHSRRTFRGSVTSKIGEVWTYRRDEDIYREKNRSQTFSPEVDHIIEMQIIDMIQIYCPVLSKAFKQEINSKSNLNVTTQEVNQVKKGPIQAWKNQFRSNDLIIC